jgi:hypothetical protein
LWKGKGIVKFFLPSSPFCISIFASALLVSNESQNENDFVNNFPRLP